MEESQLLVGAMTDPGTVRERNEDSVHHDRFSIQGDEGQEAVLLAVADGMGGYDRGDVASKMAIDTLIERVSGLDTADAALVLKQAYRRANELIYENGSAQGEDNMMGTTLVCALIIDSEATIANVGDSRAYLVRAGAMTQVSEDHSLIAEQVRMGVLSEDEAKTAGHRNIITRALGHRERVDVDIYELTLLPDDRLLLSTDGLHDFIEDDEIQSILEGNPPDEAPQLLVSRALENGSNDNATALCVWMAPVSALQTTEFETVAEERASLLLPLIAGVALLVVIAIVAVLLLL